jgi:thiamine-monophosphate kinase
MSGQTPKGLDEFGEIERLFRPLTRGDPRALDLKDDAAVIPQRKGFDLVVTKDAIVEGVHFLSSDPLDLVARKALRVNLSDLAAKGAKPFAYLLACAWPETRNWADRAAFAAGLSADQDLFGIGLLGGDSVSTSGPMVFSATLLGWTPSGSMVRRGGAKAGDILQVSGPIGDGWLGLRAARGELGLDADTTQLLADRYRLPQPRLDLNLAGATAAADVSDGLVADAGHIATASGAGLEIDLSKVPFSPEAAAWLARQPDRSAAVADLATGGDDYQIVATAPQVMLGFTAIGTVTEGQGVRVTYEGAPLALERAGYRHR